MVGKEFNTEQIADPLPGRRLLEAFRVLIHEAASVRADEKIGSKVQVINDVSRAFFEARTGRQGHRRGDP